MLDMFRVFYILLTSYPRSSLSFGRHQHDSQCSSWRGQEPGRSRTDSTEDMFNLKLITSNVIASITISKAMHPTHIPKRGGYHILPIRAITHTEVFCMTHLYA
jgi:hypothetical protein